LKYIDNVTKQSNEHTLNTDHDNKILEFACVYIVYELMMDLLQMLTYTHVV